MNHNIIMISYYYYYYDLLNSQSRLSLYICTYIHIYIYISLYDKLSCVRIKFNSHPPRFFVFYRPVRKLSAAFRCMYLTETTIRPYWWIQATKASSVKLHRSVRWSFSMTHCLCSSKLWTPIPVRTVYCNMK